MEAERSPRPSLAQTRLVEPEFQAFRTTRTGGEPANSGSLVQPALEVADALVDQRRAAGARRLLAQDLLGRRHRHVDRGGAHLVDRLRLGAGDLLLGLPGAPLQRFLQAGARLLREGFGLAARLLDDGLGLLAGVAVLLLVVGEQGSAPPRAGAAPRRAPCGSPRPARPAPWRSAPAPCSRPGSAGRRRRRPPTQNSAVRSMAGRLPTPLRAAPAPSAPRPCSPPCRSAWRRWRRPSRRRCR